MKRIDKLEKCGTYFLEDDRSDFRSGVRAKWIIKITTINEDGIIRVRDCYSFDTSKKIWKESSNDSIFEDSLEGYLVGRTLYKINKKEIENMFFVDML